MAQTIQIDFHPRAEQYQILELTDQYRFVTAVCHRRMGKTVLAANWLIREAFKGIADYRGYYIAPNQRQAKQIVWSYFKTYLAPLGKLVNFNETELRIDLPNNSKIYLAGSENIESLRGIYIDRAVMDEMASWVNPQYAFFEVLYPAMTDRQGRSTIIGTVKGLDLFHEFYMMGNDETHPEWGSIIFSVEDTDIFSPEEIANMRRLMNPDAFAREYLCDWFALTPDTLITAQELYSAVGRSVDHNVLRAFPEVWGFDVGYTNDPSQLCKRKGPLIKSFTELKNKDSVYQARWLAKQIQRENPSVLYVDAGYGEGVIAQLNDMGYDYIVEPVWFNGKSPKPNCVNMRAYMYKELKDWLPSGCIPKDDQFIKQASNQLLDETDADRRIKLQAKKKIKEIIGESPDKSDSAVLTLAGGNEDELSPEEKLRGQSADQLTAEDLKMLVGAGDPYDPLDYMDNWEEENSIDLTTLL